MLDFDNCYKRKINNPVPEMGNQLPRNDQVFLSGDKAQEARLIEQTE